MIRKRISPPAFRRIFLLHARSGNGCTRAVLNKRLVTACSARPLRLLVREEDMVRRILVISLLVGSPAVPATANAQDLNTLDRHLEQQQWQRLQDHQNRSRTMPPRKGRVPAQRQALQACNENHVPKPAYRRMEAEYQRRLQAEGKREADQWSRAQAGAWYKRLKQQRVCH